MESIEASRGFLKAGPWGEWAKLERDERKGIPPPPLQEPCPEGAKLIDLIAPENLTVGTMPLREAIHRRRSRRKFTHESLSLEELSFLLWAIQGVREVVRDGVATRRTVPSGGARHAFETYLLVNRVAGMESALYRYLPLDHKLCFLRADPDLPQKVAEACCQQKFVGEGAVVFIWTAIPYRMEWRYGILSPKVIAIDAGHVCQNLYLASESIGAGACAIGAYHQEKMDSFLGVDGKDEFVIYAAPVGKIE